MAFKLKYLTHTGDLTGKKILLRVDFNVGITDGKVTEDFRLRKILPTFQSLKEKRARTLLVSHIENKKENSLAAVLPWIEERFPETKFARDFAEARQFLEDSSNGDFVLLENIRNWSGEKKNDEKFAANLASLAEIYVNDAFSVSHRAHASIVGVPKFLPSFAGLLFESEVENLSQVFNPPRPFVFILGGVKFETKMPLLEKFLHTADQVFVGGALANDLLKVKGYEIGDSKISEKTVDFSRIIGRKNLLLPVDVVVENSRGKFTKQVGEISDGDRILDVGDKSIELIKTELNKSKFVLWNGPMGCYEKGFISGSENLAYAISESNAVSVIGGGDTIPTISRFGLEDKFSFVSTGGGAMLDFLANETLPGIQALEKSNF